MSIRKIPRPSGTRWQVRLSVGGRRIEKVLPAGATRADAVEAETRLRHQHIDRTVGRQPARTIDDALGEWVKTGATRLKSWDKDLRYRVAAIREWTAGKALDDLPSVAETLKADGIASGLSPAGVNRYLAILRRVGNLAVKWGWTDKALGRRVELLPGETQRHLYLTSAQVKAIAKACSDPVAADVVRFAALTGLRRGEILRLTPEMVVEGAVVLDAQTKSGRPRVVPLPPQARTIARRRLPWRITPAVLRDQFEAARKAAGLPEVRMHDLRHAFASWAVKGGASLAAVRDLLGHSSLAVTSKYAHLSRPDLAKVTAKIKI